MKAMFTGLLLAAALMVAPRAADACRVITFRDSNGSLQHRVTSTCITGMGPMARVTGTTTFHDKSGRVTGRAERHVSGATTFYDKSGDVTGYAKPGDGGTTTFYDAMGRETGRASRAGVNGRSK